MQRARQQQGSPPEGPTAEPRAQQLALLAEPGPAATAEGRRLIERRASVGWAEAWREYVEAMAEQPRGAD